jgi:hypothetical protein
MMSWNIKSGDKMVQLPAELVEEIREWRRQQRDLPSFTAAVRTLIKLGLSKENRDENAPVDH